MKLHVVQSTMQKAPYQVPDVLRPGLGHLT